MTHIAAVTAGINFVFDKTNTAAEPTTSAETINAAVSIDVDKDFRFRADEYETAGGDSTSDGVLEYDLNASGTFSTVDATTPVQFTAFVGTTDGTATTEQLTSASGTFVAGECDDTGSVTGVDLVSQQTEFLYCLTLDSAQVANGDTIDLRIKGLDSYTNTGRSTAVAAAAPDALLADDLESSSEVSTPTVGQEHVLLADNLESGSELSTPTAAEASGTDALLADNLESSAQLSTPAVGQAHILAADNDESQPELSTPALAQVHALVANNVESSCELSKPVAAEVAGGEDTLLADNIQSSSQLSTPSMGQAHVLTADSEESISQLSTPSTGQIHTLLADNVESWSNLSSPSVSEPLAGNTIDGQANLVMSTNFQSNTLYNNNGYYVISAS